MSVRPDWTHDDLHLNAWPEAGEALAALKEWCEDQGVTGPEDYSMEVGHRPRVNVDPVGIGFGCIVQPIPANSKEWNSQAGQSALKEEMDNHM